MYGSDKGRGEISASDEDVTFTIIFYNDWHVYTFTLCTYVQNLSGSYIIPGEAWPTSNFSFIVKSSFAVLCGVSTYCTGLN